MLGYSRKYLGEEAGGNSASKLAIGLALLGKLYRPEIFKSGSTEASCLLCCLSNTGCPLYFGLVEGA